MFSVCLHDLCSEVGQLPKTGTTPSVNCSIKTNYRKLSFCRACRSYDLLDLLSKQAKVLARIVRNCL